VWNLDQVFPLLLISNESPSFLLGFIFILGLSCSFVKKKKLL
jgi:hypothetical protein